MVPSRSVLLACGALVSSTAMAADLPTKAATSVEYVRVCTSYGEGFFYVPGTDSCLRIGGRMRADYLYVEPFTRDQDAIGFRARGRLNIDHRTMTAYGQLRTYIRYEIDRNTGVFAGTGQVSTNPKIQQAFIQFGGLTAGRVTSFFTDPDLPVPNFGDLRFDDPSNADVDPVRLYVLIRQWLLGHPVARRRSRAPRQQRARVPLVRRRGRNRRCRSRLHMAASACPTSSRTCDTPAPGAARRSPARCTRSAMWRLVSPRPTA